MQVAGEGEAEGGRIEEGARKHGGERETRRHEKSQGGKRGRQARRMTRQSHSLIYYCCVCLPKYPVPALLANQKPGAADWACEKMQVAGGGGGGRGGGKKPNERRGDQFRFR